MIVADTSVIYALLDANDSNHEIAAAWYLSELPPLATTPLILAEVDHLAATRAGTAAQHAFHTDIASGAYDVAWWADAATEAVEVVRQYSDLGIGLADASLVALAARLKSTSIATFDQRHFRAIRPLTGNKAFRLLPIDA